MASRLQDVLLVGVRGAQPAANAVAIGTLYAVSNEAFLIEQSNGTTWSQYGPSPSGGTGLNQLTGDVTAGPGSGSQVASLNNVYKIKQIGITIDGGGSAITTGVKGYRSFPNSGVITGVRMLADQVGSAVIDIWKDTFAAYPPTVLDTITAAAKPTISAANKSENLVLTGWNTTVNAGDVFGFNVDSAATITRLTLELTIRVA